MTVSLYECSIKNYLQTLPGIVGIMDKAEQFCQSRNLNRDELMLERLYPDMWPMSMQLVSVVHHSLGAVKGVIRGEFNPPGKPDDVSFHAMLASLKEAIAELEGYTKEDINRFSGTPVAFRMGDFELPFNAENFILSFSLPNFYFHVTTAYDIFRQKGVPLGKMDYLGAMRITR